MRPVYHTGPGRGLGALPDAYQEACPLKLIGLLCHTPEMTKKEIHQRFVEQIAAELAVISDAAEKEMATATNAEHQAKSKYETFSLETSYLARGQAKRVAEFSVALEQLQMLPLKELSDKTPVQLSALVRLEGADGSKRVLFFCPAAGGESIMADGEVITIVTSESPIGRAVVGKYTGHTFEIRLGGDTQMLIIKSVT
jgi:transcription elongation GreA/GreB family factor